MLQIFLWAQKLQNLTLDIIQILQSHSLQYGDVQVIFKVLLNYKMAAIDEFQFFWGRRNSKT